MKKNFLPAFLLLFLALGLFSCQQGTKETNKEYPMFWTWLDYRPGMNFDSICQVMNDIGMDGIMLNAPTPDDYRVAIPIAHKHGIEVYAWLWTMNLEHDRDKILKEHPEWFSVNRNGKSLADTTAYVGYYKFLCPALPEVREFIKEKIKTYCEVEGLNGIAIDYHRLWMWCFLLPCGLATALCRTVNTLHGITAIIRKCSRSSRSSMVMTLANRKTLRLM